jgi:hypothetical protein
VKPRHPNNCSHPFNMYTSSASCVEFHHASTFQPEPAPTLTYASTPRVRRRPHLRLLTTCPPPPTSLCQAHLSIHENGRTFLIPCSTHRTSSSKGASCLAGFMAAKRMCPSLPTPWPNPNPNRCTIASGPAADMTSPRPVDRQGQRGRPNRAQKLSFLSF